MIVIRTAEDLARVLSEPPDPELLSLLQAQADRLAEYPDFTFEELGMFAIVQPGDDLNSIDAAIGWALLDDDTFARPVELIVQHGSWIEATFILSDDGFGLVLFVPIDASTDSQLLAACKRALIEA